MKRFLAWASAVITQPIEEGNSIDWGAITWLTYAVGPSVVVYVVLWWAGVWVIVKRRLGTYKDRKRSVDQ